MVVRVLSRRERAVTGTEEETNRPIEPEKEFPTLSENSLRVLKKRYLRRDGQGNVVETPNELFRRVAKNVASADKKYGADEKIAEEEFYTVMRTLEFIPNSPTLMNAGNDLQQLSACFVLPVDDSMDSIFDAVKFTALIHKSGGGTGFSFSRLRPAGDLVCSTQGVSSGPISFMKVFNAATEAVKQGGTRRGANMGVLRVDHPDILDFINCKIEEISLNNFNISVAITDEFMRRVEKDEDYELINPHTKKPVRKQKAKEVFNKIVENAWKNGEPGIIFIDRINRDNPTPAISEIESTNPCGEQPLLPYESCNLGSINLARMVKFSSGSADKYEIDWDKLRRTTWTAVHFLDNVVEMNRFPLPEIEKMTKSNRKIGLGVMGFADFLYQLEIAYNSDDAVNLAEKVMMTIKNEAVKSSQMLAQQRGPFPNFKESIYANHTPRRNATLTTIAPTGTIGIIAEASSGIEPVFALAYVRKNVLDHGTELQEVNKHFELTLRRENVYTPELIAKVAEKGSVQDIKEIPEWIRKVYVTAMDIPPEAHIRMQVAFQKFVDNAVSKTVNFPNSATKEDIARVYLSAYKSGAKGVTVYRDGSREKQVLNIQRKDQSTTTSDRNERKPRVRPNLTTGATLKMRTGCGNMYVTINEDGQGLCEVFTQLGKSGGCASSQAEAIGRLVSLSLRAGVPVNEIIDQLRNIRCPLPGFSEKGEILSCPDALSKAMEGYINERTVPTLFTSTVLVSPTGKNISTSHKNSGKTGTTKSTGLCPECPECGGILVFSEGCVLCSNCGYSRCS